MSVALPAHSTRAKPSSVPEAFRESPIVGVVRTDSRADGERQAREFADGGLQLVEITYTVPEGTEIVRDLLAERADDSGTFVGMGTITNRARAEAALAAGAEFLITPNVSPEVADIAKRAGVFLILGALTPTEILEAARLGADLVKVYPLPPVGGAHYLRTVRQPLPDVPILAAGGFGAEEIPAYREAGASAYGLGVQLLGPSQVATRTRITRALEAATG